jgi:hypothetical protein
MLDARTFPPNLTTARAVLAEQHWNFKGEYKIRDCIFKSKDPSQTLATVFLRLRFIPLNIWNEKKVIVSIKNTELKSVGKKSIIPVREQFDTEDEARTFIQQNYSDTFEFDFEFRRVGWQYDLNGDQVDLEEIEGYASVEYKSPTESGLRALLDTFGVTDDEVLKGPSVIEMRNRIVHPISYQRAS